MKVRTSFVSNSSSSSFIIFNWFDIPEEKRTSIMNYDESVWELWHKKKIKIEQWKDSSGYNKDYPFYGDEFSSKDDQSKSKYNFGFINNSCRWYFNEYELENTCVVSTTMDNFDMGAWLRYNNVAFEGTEE